ncbi:MAG: hypothetical protein RLZZ540_2073 [Bacteroidota bacterium]|jgi:hypothetical protein
MLTINQFKNVKNSFIDKNVTIDEVFSTIKNGDSNLETILAIRKLGKSSSIYQKTKTHNIPTFRFNFKFEGKATNETIIEPTGLIYIDVDDSTTIDLTNPHIYACWKSLSETGLGILVKVDGLSLNNFKDTYHGIGNMLGIPMDLGACKATQQNVLTYDANLYENKNSLTFQAINKKVSFTPIQEGEKRERLITVNDTFLQSDKIRFNNIDDYFKGTDGDYIVFDEKKNLCIPFIPKRIDVGQRNITMFGVLSQYALLNPTKETGFLMACANEINRHFTQKYEEDKIKSIIAGVLKKRKEGTLELYLNQERRILFNPNKKITKEEKQKTTAVLMGKIKTDKTQKSINETIENWNFQCDGKITQEKITEKLNKSLSTIKRNWSPFKELVTELNNSSKAVLMIAEELLTSTKKDSSEVLKIDNNTIIDGRIENIESFKSHHKEPMKTHAPTIVDSTISVERFIYNCKYKFGSYVADKRFETLKKDLEEIWNLKLMSDVTEEIKKYINSQIDYPNEDGYYVKLQLLK